MRERQGPAVTWEDLSTQIAISWIMKQDMHTMPSRHNMSIIRAHIKRKLKHRHFTKNNPSNLISSFSPFLWSYSLLLIANKTKKYIKKSSLHVSGFSHFSLLLFITVWGCKAMFTLLSWFPNRNHEGSAGAFNRQTLTLTAPTDSTHWLIMGSIGLAVVSTVLTEKIALHACAVLPIKSSRATDRGSKQSLWWQCEHSLRPLTAAGASSIFPVLQYEKNIV